MRSFEDLAEAAADERLKRLLSYAAADPENAALRSDIAERAIETGEPGIACDVLGRNCDALDDKDLNLLGLAQLQARAFEEAVESFEALMKRGVSSDSVRFNYAWALASSKAFERALEALGEETARALPQAAMLEVQLLHELGEFERAEAAARRHIEAHPDHQGLAAAVSVLAIDVEDVELARRSAEIAGNHPDALATLGTLALETQEADRALELFDRALETNDHSPRAWIGRGLAHLLQKDGRAAPDIDRGAELFGDHLGSWIAAGWAHLIEGDRATARERFERALAIDDRFAETHGSLAVIDVLDGKPEAAKKGITTALKLDPQCFSGSFAKTLLLAGEGKEKQSRQLFEKILEAPVNDRGDTAADALARMGLR